MPIFRQTITIHDGEFEYEHFEFVFAKDEATGAKLAIANMHFNNKRLYKVVEWDTFKKPCSWEEVSPGYRIYELDEIEKAHLYVTGLSAPVDLNMLMGRPVLPMTESQAEYRWKRSGNNQEFWWIQGDIVVWANWEPGDRELLYIGSFPYFQIEAQKIEMKIDNWFIERGPEQEE